MKTTEFSGHITGNPVRQNCSKDGKTIFVNFSIAFYGGKKNGVDFSEYLDVSIVSDDAERIAKIVPLLEKGNFVTGRGKLTASIYHQPTGVKKVAVIKEQVKCRLESIQIISRKAAEPTDEDCLSRVIGWGRHAMKNGQSLELFLADCVCRLYSVSHIDEIEAQDDDTAELINELKAFVDSDAGQAGTVYPASESLPARTEAQNIQTPIEKFEDWMDTGAPMPEFPQHDDVPY